MVRSYATTGEFAPIAQVGKTAHITGFATLYLRFEATEFASYHVRN